MRLKNSAAVVLVTSLFGCVSTEHLTRAYQSSAVRMNADRWRGYEVAPGENVILENSRYVSALPFVVDGISGYTLHIELSPQRITKGAAIAIPSEGAKAYLHTLRAPSYANVEVFGAVRIVEVLDASISVETDLKAKDVEWAQIGTDTYRYARHSCIGKVDWACEFYTK